ILIVKGPQVMIGYWNMEKETEIALRNGWLYTGDIAYMDEEGYCFIVSRKKDVILASGYSVYPREIEEVLYEHPAVQEVVVCGIPDDYRSEEHTSELQSRFDLVCRLLLEKKKRH